MTYKLGEDRVGSGGGQNVRVSDVFYSSRAEGTFLNRRTDFRILMTRPVLVARVPCAVVLAILATACRQTRSIARTQRE
jgi:hypothetical protein